MVKTLKNICLLIISIVVCLTASELFLWLLKKPAYHTIIPDNKPRFSYIRTSDKDIFWTNKINDTISIKYDSNPRNYFNKNNSVKHSVNSMGFRGIEFKSNKEENDFNIAFLGDSFTFGEGVKDQDIFACKIIESLNNHENYSKNFLGFNFGVGGYNIIKTNKLLNSSVFNINPDLLIFSITLNDAEATLFTVKENNIIRRTSDLEYLFYSSMSPPAEEKIYRFRTAQLTWKFLRHIRLNNTYINYYQNLYAENSLSWQHNKRAFLNLIKKVKQKNTPIVIVLFPLFYNLNNKYPFWDIHKKIHKLVLDQKHNDLYFIDLLPVYSSFNHSDLIVHPTDHHPNEKAHEIAAETIFNCIKQKNIII